MASSSSAAAATAIALIAATGCWTGRLFEAGRLRESVLAYHSATLDGEALRLGYSVERVCALPWAPSHEVRAASVPLAALAAEPELPVDAFPVEFASPRSNWGRATPLRIVIAGDEAQRGRASGEAMAPWVVEVEVRHGRHAGLRLCRLGVAPCLGHLYSEVLYRDRIAWWIYPLVPVALALDVALFPTQLVSVGFFWLGD